MSWYGLKNSFVAHRSSVPQCHHHILNFQRSRLCKFGNIDCPWCLRHDSRGRWLWKRVLERWLSAFIDFKMPSFSTFPLAFFRHLGNTRSSEEMSLGTSHEVDKSVSRMSQNTGFRQFFIRFRCFPNTEDSPLIQNISFFSCLKTEKRKEKQFHKPVLLTPWMTRSR